MSDPNRKIVNVPFGEVETKDGPTRRYLSWGMNFDTRSVMLEEVSEHWEPIVKEQHTSNRNRIIEGLIHEFGNQGHRQKVANFIALNTKPFSVVAQHTTFFDQVRNAFVGSAYFPALVGACSLGERILNHLVLDLRDYFSDSEHHNLVAKKNSFANWHVPITALNSWGVFVDGIADNFKELAKLRNKSIHFDHSTYATAREDALRAILLLRAIIERQFGSFGQQPWYIPNTPGQCFVKKSFESNPFVKTYIIPRCPFVGPLFTMKHSFGGWQCFDFDFYSSNQISDQDFATLFNSREISEMANTEIHVQSSL